MNNAPLFRAGMSALFLALAACDYATGPDSLTEEGGAGKADSFGHVRELKDEGGFTQIRFEYDLRDEGGAIDHVVANPRVRIATFSGPVSPLIAIFGSGPERPDGTAQILDATAVILDCEDDPAGEPMICTGSFPRDLTMPLDETRDPFFLRVLRSGQDTIDPIRGTPFFKLVNLGDG